LRGLKVDAPWLDILKNEVCVSREEFGLAFAEFEMHGAPAMSRGPRLETAEWGPFDIGLGVRLLAGSSGGIFCFGTGVPMLGGRALRHDIGIGLDRFCSAVGTCFVVFGGILGMRWRIDEITMATWFVPGLFIVVGAALIIPAWRRRPNA
jgi:hypothetical protein